jgi:ubiquinone/menaquinone biosynthesis C-methylase UbiE
VETQDFDYILGCTDAELRRLKLQAAFCERQTRVLLLEAGLCRGQHLLDFGCGIGDVSFLAAELVGEHGHVIGIDRSEKMVQTARAQAQKLGLRQVEFVCSDDIHLAKALLRSSFDWLTGRLVLGHQPDPVACLRRLTPFLKPGGRAVFQEVQMAAGWHGSLPPSLLLNQIWSWLTATTQRAGLETNMGLRLREVFLACGFSSPTLLLTARVEYGPESVVYEYVAETVRSLLPVIIKFGIANEAEIDIDTLAERLRAECLAQDGVLLPSMLVGGYAKLNPTAQIGTAGDASTAR